MRQQALVSGLNAKRWFEREAFVKTGATSAQRLTKSSVAISYARSILKLSFEFAHQFRFHFVPHRSPIQSQLLANKVVLTQLRVDHGDVML